MIETTQSHVPVLLSAMLDKLAPQAEEIIVDGTFGVGGYSRAILEKSKAHVIAVDRDPEALLRSQAFKDEFGNRFQFIQGCFGDLEVLLETHGIAQVDGIVLDLGVSSPQLDQAERGFSFRKEGPLDMRMGSSAITAAEVVNTFDEKAIADILFRYGEERQSRKIARHIVQQRANKSFETTQELADLLRKVLPFERKGHDPATRTFQALRIYVNDELGELEHVLEASARLLRPGGRLVIVTFHSLEDRLVKSFIREKSGHVAQGSRHQPEIVLKSAIFKDLCRKAIESDTEEIKINPRARSAKLRAAMKLES